LRYYIHTKAGVKDTNRWSAVMYQVDEYTQIGLSSSKGPLIELLV
jgi:hypothetical protein